MCNLSSRLFEKVLISNQLICGGYVYVMISESESDEGLALVIDFVERR